MLYGTIRRIASELEGWIRLSCVCFKSETDEDGQEAGLGIAPWRMVGFLYLWSILVRLFFSVDMHSGSQGCVNIPMFVVIRILLQYWYTENCHKFLPKNKRSL